MKKVWITLFTALALVVVVVVVIWPRRASKKFSVGAPLPPGKVRPQLVNTWDTAALLAPDGSIWIWGGAQFQLNGLFPRSVVAQTPQPVGFGSDWRQMSASHQHILALKSDGSLWGWGNNGSGQLAQPAGVRQSLRPVRIGSNKWLQVSAGMGHSLGLRDDGSLWAWGQNDHGQVGDGTKTNQFTLTLISQDKDWKTIEAGAFNSFALRRNGTIWGWGLDPSSGGFGDSLSPQQIDPSTNWGALSSGDYCLLALKADGTLWLRGQNAHIMASDFAKASATNFIQIGHDSDWKEVYAGQSFFFARKKDGSWWVCGQNYQFALGTGTRGDVGSPRRLPFGFEPWAFAPGYGNTLLLARDGMLWSWGERLGTGRSAGGRRSVKSWLNQVLGLLLRRRLLKVDDTIIDTELHFLWELPVEVRRTLGASNETAQARNTDETSRSDAPSLVSTQALPAAVK